jgi:NADPH2:quinone reductase
MKALVLTKYGNAYEAFEIREMKEEVLLHGEVRIEVSASGLNFADVLGRKGLYPALPPTPVVMGYDVVGKITEIGEGVDIAWMGKRVAALTRFGGYASSVNTNVEGLVELPESISDEEGCALGTQYATALYMSDYLQSTKKGERVLVHAAAGGVGTALVQLLLNKGCEVYATAGSDAKVNALMKLGVKAINYRHEDYEEALSKYLGNRKLDVVFNSIGGKTFKKDMRLLGAGGRLLLFGYSERTSMWGGKWATLRVVMQMGRLIPIMLLAQSKSVLGVNMLNVAVEKPALIGELMSRLVKLHVSGVIKPVIGKVYSYVDVAEAHHDLESRNTQGKLVLKW